MREPGVDLIVVNYRTPHDLSGFLDSYNRHVPTIPHSLTVVNVDPEPEDVRVAGDAPAVITFPDNVGYARACNAAATTGNFTIVAFFNADIRLAAGAIDECFAMLNLFDDWGVLGPRQVGDDGTITSAGIFGTRAEPQLRGWRRADSEEWGDIRDDAVSVSGSAYFVKRQLWDTLTGCPLYAPGLNPLGAFLPTRHYYEETFCSYHALEHGWKVVYYGPVTLIHRWHQASPVDGWADRLWSESKSLFVWACQSHNIPHD